MQQPDHASQVEWLDVELQRSVFNLLHREHVVEDVVHRLRALAHHRDELKRLRRHRVPQLLGQRFQPQSDTREWHAQLVQCVSQERPLRLILVLGHLQLHRLLALRRGPPHLLLFPQRDMVPERHDAREGNDDSRDGSDGDPDYEFRVGVNELDARRRVRGRQSALRARRARKILARGRWSHMPKWARGALAVLGTVLSCGAQQHRITALLIRRHGLLVKGVNVFLGDIDAGHASTVGGSRKLAFNAGDRHQHVQRVRVLRR
mmetsp:Transcript_5186/g.18636  ORF Transcript_5186/g.18636 Transcript_5186/m.18636 type:complete len:262 (+) Transcript_5186:1497-2282(+)